jgi:DnaA family protein
VKTRSSSITAISTAGWAIKQIALPLSLDRQFSFANFICPRDQLIVASLEALLRGDGETQVGLWGDVASGKTHLLNASAHFARERGIDLQLYDAEQLVCCDAAAFDGYGDCDVLAVDNLDAVAGDAGWEAFFYQAINRCRDGEYRFVYTLGARPENLPFGLADLRSRLQWGLLLQLPASGDAEVRDILHRRAALLGFELGGEVITYLMNRYPRDLSAQMSILRYLDGASLSQQRRVTIPLVRQALRERLELASGLPPRTVGEPDK